MCKLDSEKKQTLLIYPNPIARFPLEMIQLTPYIIVPRSKLSLISAVYLL